MSGLLNGSDNHPIRWGMLAVALAGCLLVAVANGVAAGPTGHMLNIIDDFGAVGDGEADDTEALQNAFGSRGDVYIPEGTYRFTKTLVMRGGTKIYGHGGHWNPQGATTLLYDGPEGGTAIKAKQAHFFQMRGVTLNGNNKAGIGIYWEYSCNEAMLEDVAIRQTTEHALFITRTWYAYFNRLVVRDNLGNGVTCSRKVGAVNYVNFINCRFSSNGEDYTYSDENFETGYGFGFLGAGTVCNLIGCCMEGNGGPGLYLKDWAVNFTVSGAYFEQNAQAPIRRDIELHGKDVLLNKNRPPTERWPSILTNLTGGQWGVVFDNVYIHGKNGLWLKGNGAGDPLQFRNVHGPPIIWAEHGNWEWIDSYTKTQVARLPGVFFRPKGQSYRWWAAEGIASGHPGHKINSGVRTVFPAPEEGLTLYVDSDNGDDANDGRTPEQAWQSLQKVADLFRNCTVDTPFMVVVTGQEAAHADFLDISGAGSVEIRTHGSARLGVITAKNVSCRLGISSRAVVTFRAASDVTPRLVAPDGGSITIDQLRVDRCAQVTLDGLTFAGGFGGNMRLACFGGSNVNVADCHFVGSLEMIGAIVARENCRVSVVNSTFVRVPSAGQELVATSGAVIKTEQ